MIRACLKITKKKRVRVRIPKKNVILELQNKKQACIQRILPKLSGNL